MEDYERWVQNILCGVKAEKEYEETCKQCDIEVAVAEFLGQDVNQIVAESEQKKLHAELEKDLMNRF